MNEISVDYVDGFLRCLSDGCHGTDYVPYYGAKSFANDSKNILESLKKHFGIVQFSTKHHRKLDDFKLLKESEWKKQLESLLKKWVDEKYLEGELLKMKKWRSFLKTHKDDLLEQIYLLAGSDFVSFSARLEHEEYEYDCQIIGFVGENNAFFLHFSFSD